jgi:hypothetical protein
MTPDQTKMILAKAALIDNRTVDIHVIKAWFEVIGHFEYEDALEALNLHRLESTEYLLPAHIKNNMTRAKAMRKTAEAKQRAIETTRICKLIESTGCIPTPANIEAMREVTANTEPADRLELVAEIVDEPETAERTPLNLYERMKNSPEGREAMMRGNFLKSA